MIKLRKNLFEGDGHLTQRFGEHPDWYAVYGLEGHNGIDYGVPVGRELYCCIYGVVTEVANDGNDGYGKYVKIENDECGVLYAHLSKFNVKVGDIVSSGQVLGWSGNTGNSTGPHLHFGVFPKPRDRTNGFNGYIDSFNKKLVEWVAVLLDPFLNTEIADLKQEIEELKESVKHYKEGRNEAIKDSNNKQKEIDKLGSRVGECEGKVSELKVRIKELVASSNYTLGEHFEAMIGIIINKVVKSIKEVLGKDEIK